MKSILYIFFFPIALFYSCREYQEFSPYQAPYLSYSTNISTYSLNQPVRITFKNKTLSSLYTIENAYRSFEIRTDTGWTTVAAIVCDPDCPATRVGIGDSIYADVILNNLSGTFRVFTYYTDSPGITITNGLPLFSNEFIINP